MVCCAGRPPRDVEQFASGITQLFLSSGSEHRSQVCNPVASQWKWSFCCEVMGKSECPWKEEALQEQSQLSWLLAPQESPNNNPRSSLSLFPIARTWLYSSASLPHPLALFVILNPREKRALQSPCSCSPRLIAFAISIPIHFHDLPSCSRCSASPLPGAEVVVSASSWFPAQGCAGIHRDAAMPQELKLVSLGTTWGQVTWSSQQSRYGERRGHSTCNCWIQSLSAIWVLPYVMDWKYTLSQSSPANYFTFRVESSVRILPRVNISNLQVPDLVMVKERVDNEVLS